MKKLTPAILITFMIILLTDIKPRQAARYAKFRSVTNRWSPKYFTNFTAYIKNGSIFCDMQIIQPLKTGFKASMEIQIRLRKSEKYQTLFAYNFDVCNMIIDYKNTIFKKWFKSLLRYGNFMPNCPINIGRYYLNGWKMESSLIPSYLYAGDYRIKANGFFGKLKGKDQDFVIDLIFDTLITDN